MRSALSPEMTTGTFRALSMAGDPLATSFGALGTLERSKDDRTRMRVEFSPTGAGVHRVQFAEYFETIERTSNYAALEEWSERGPLPE